MTKAFLYGHQHQVIHTFSLSDHSHCQLKIEFSMTHVKNTIYIIKVLHKSIVNITQMYKANVWRVYSVQGNQSFFSDD